MKINFKCTKCNKKFDSNVGEISINEKSFRPDFENDIKCPRCGIRNLDQVRLTELGQTQMTVATMNI